MNARMDDTLWQVDDLQVHFPRPGKGLFGRPEVVKAVGVEGLNQLWDDPLNAPSIEEIASPLTWVHRVIGTDYLGRDS